MKIWFDTEFYENGETIEPISLGLVKDDGKLLYLVNPDVYKESWKNKIKEECERNGSDTYEWLEKNVFNNLNAKQKNIKPVSEWPAILEKACGEEPEFWASTCAYDWVLMAQLFGRMMGLPKGWPKRCRDTAELKKMFPEVEASKYVPEWVRVKFGKHNALYDAIETRSKYYSYLDHVQVNNISIEI